MVEKERTSCFNARPGSVSLCNYYRRRRLAWEQAAQYVSQQLHIELPVYFIKEDHAAYYQWKQATGMEEGEAILVRPDGFIAWRHAACTDATNVLTNALKSILSIA